MKLTDKAKELFEEWYVNNPVHYYDGHPIQLRFEYLDVRCQWGVYQDWADSLGYSIGLNYQQTTGTCRVDIWRRRSEKEKTGKNDWMKKKVGHIPTYITRKEARNAAIEKLNELINQ